MAHTATEPEAQPDIGVVAVDPDTRDRVRKLHEKLIQGDILQYLGPERYEISHLLDRDKRRQIFERLQKKREDFFPGVAAEQLEKDLDVLSEYLDTLAFMQRAHKSYKQDTQSPEKAGMFQRAFESVKGFAKRHPVVTTLLAAAAAVGVAGYYYWPQIIALAQGVWEARGLAAAGEVAEAAEAGTALEVPNALEGVGSAATSVPEGLAPAIPPGASSAGFPMNPNPDIPFNVPVE